MREVIAGCRLAVGDERALTRKCEERSKGLALRIVELSDLAKKLDTWHLLGPLLAGVGGFVLGGLIGIITAVLRPATIQALSPTHAGGLTLVLP
jgi:hypothetical protein